MLVKLSDDDYIIGFVHGIKQGEIDFGEKNESSTEQEQTKEIQFVEFREDFKKRILNLTKPEFLELCGRFWDESIPPNQIDKDGDNLLEMEKGG